MTDNIYLKRPNEFKAIQFTGGQENAEAVMAWLHENSQNSLGHVSWQKHSPTTISGQEWITFWRRTVRPGSWFVVDSHNEETQVFTDEEFQKLFVLTQEFTEETIIPTESETNSDESVEILNVSVQAAALANIAIALLKARGEQMALAKAVGKRIADWVSSEQLKTNSEYGQNESDEAVISNGVIDSVPGADYVIEYAKHNEDTLQLVWEALRQTGMGDFDINNAITQMQNAGILFRERV